jgi:serine/threonine protein kinase
MNNKIVYNEKGEQLRLLNSLKSGGEGTIYTIQGYPLKCAKIYHPKKLTTELCNKISAMITNPPKDPTIYIMQHTSIAWPESILFNDSNKKDFVGFVMPFINTKHFKESQLYFSPSDRLKNYGGNFNWKYLFTTAYNITSAIAAVHEKGHCIGDLREVNIFVAPDALVTLVDCDSFQIQDRNGKTFYTRVGTGEYLPPELFGVDFEKANYDRHYSDLFALSILIFKMLMQGTHPYQAKGKLVEEASSTEMKIMKGLYPYSSKFKGIFPPDHAPPYDILPPSIKLLFEKCFIDGHKDLAKRPTAKEWFNVLQIEGKRLKECARNKNHYYAAHRASCPWCEIKNLNIDPFPEPFGQQIALADLTKISGALQDRIEVIKTYISMALIDGILTIEEKDSLLDIGSKLSIPKNEVEKLIDKELQLRNAKITKSQKGIPILELSNTYFEFYNVKHGSTLTSNFTINNSGGGILTGSIVSQINWLKPLQDYIDTTRHRQIVEFEVNTGNLSLGFRDKGIIEIRSNGGTRFIEVNLSVEIPDMALARFRWQFLPAIILIAIFGGLFINSVWFGIVFFFIGSLFAKTLFRLQLTSGKNVVIPTWVIAAVAMTLVYAIPASTNNTSTLIGSVIDNKSRIPLSGVIINLTDMNINEYTNSNGQFKFKNITPGYHNVLITYSGYKEVIKTGIYIGGARATVMDIDLEKLINKHSAKVERPRHNSTMGEIMSSSAVIRTFYFANAESVGSIPQFERVYIIDRWKPGNSDAYIVTMSTAILSNEGPVQVNRGELVYMIAEKGSNLIVSYKHSNKEIVGEIPAGYLAKCENETWYKIRTQNNIVGWISSKSVKLIEE